MPRRIAVVGAAGAGKLRFVKALGASGCSPKSGSKDNARQRVFKWNPWRPTSTPVTLEILHDDEAEALRPSRGDILVVVCDLTRLESVYYAMNHWSHDELGGVSGDLKILLIGSHADCLQSRAITTPEASALAEGRFDRYIETCSTTPPFRGIDRARQILELWAIDGNRKSPPTSPMSAPAFLPISHGRYRSYSENVSTTEHIGDPRDEEESSSSDSDSGSDPGDVRLRPISRALFEIREAGHSKMKQLAACRQTTLTRFMRRSRYFGPTESSRLSRWRKQQRTESLSPQDELIAQHRHRPRVCSEDTLPEVSSRSYLRPTELMRRRSKETEFVRRQTHLKKEEHLRACDRSRDGKKGRKSPTGIHKPKEKSLVVQSALEDPLEPVIATSVGSEKEDLALMKDSNLWMDQMDGMGNDSLWMEHAPSMEMAAWESAPAPEANTTSTAPAEEAAPDAGSSVEVQEPDQVESVEESTKGTDALFLETDTFDLNQSSLSEETNKQSTIVPVAVSDSGSDSPSDSVSDLLDYFDNVSLPL